MPLSDQVIRDGDQGFIGFASRLNPLTLPAGVLQLSEKALGCLDAFSAPPNQ